MGLVHLVRLPNLVIVALTQYLIYYRLVRPAILEAGISPVLDHRHLAFLVLVTLLITAAGYIINDVTDYEIDLINRPQRVILERRISFQTAYWLVFSISFLGFLLSLYLAFYVDRMYLLSLYPLALAGLYFYSTHFKRLPLAGNLIIALFCAGAAAVIWLAELPALRELNARDYSSFTRTWSFFLWYLVFAFVITTFREMVKDLEDVRGDRAGQCRTLPIVWGEGRARWLALFSGLALLAFLGYHASLFYPQLGKPAVTYIGLAVGLPLLATLAALTAARSERDYHRISQATKVIILLGVLGVLFFR